MRAKYKPEKVFNDELLNKNIPAPKPLKEITKENWIKIPV